MGFKLNKDQHCSPPSMIQVQGTSGESVSFNGGSTAPCGSPGKLKVTPTDCPPCIQDCDIDHDILGDIKNEIIRIQTCCL